MSQSNGAEISGSQKRLLEEGTAADDNKRVKSEPANSFTDDKSLGDIFDLLLFETRPEASNLDFSNAALKLPDFLSDTSNQSHIPQTSTHPSQSTHTLPVMTQSSIKPSPNNQSQHASHLPATSTSSVGLQPASMGPSGSGLATSQFRSQQNMQRVSSSPRLSDYSASGSSSQQGSLYHSQSTLNLNSSTYPRSGSATPAGTRPVPAVSSPYRGTTRFDPQSAYNGPATVPAPSLHSATSYGFPQSLGNPNSHSAAEKDKPDDPSKLNDALAAAGVDLQREEELLSSNYSRLPLNSVNLQYSQRPRQGYVQQTAFLQPYHLAVFMNRVGRDNGMAQNFLLDTEMLEFMSSACKEWISNLVAKTAAMAKHRRRGIPALTSAAGSGASGRQKFVPNTQRSEVSKDLRELAIRQKALEEQRVQKRALLGLEKSGEVAPETNGKDGNDETHRAANATAAMMTMNPSRKKYSWMTSGAAGGGAEDAKSSTGKDSALKQSVLILARGDNGLRFREIRTGNMITTRDLLSVIEDERMGTAKAVVKGYARLKD